jgi:hypothetical protein
LLSTKLDIFSKKRNGFIVFFTSMHFSKRKRGAKNEKAPQNIIKKSNRTTPQDRQQTRQEDRIEHKH